MARVKTYENYPLWIVALSALFSILVYALGAYIFLQFGPWPLILYLAYCFWVEIKILKKSCPNCFYYGKICAFSRGKTCSLFFPKGDPQKFTQREISFTDILPDLLLSLFPLLGGVFLLIRESNWTTVGVLVALVVFSTAGNGLVRGSLACKYCRQKEIGCPAEKFFRKKKGKS